MHDVTTPGRRVRAWTALALLAAVVVVVGIVVTADRSPRDLPASIPPIGDEYAVEVTFDDGVVTLRPTSASPRAGMVFYPGARILPGPYAPTLAPVADALDLLVLVPAMPFNLATLDRDAMVRVAARYPEIDRWIVGGHSMGGFATFDQLDREPETVTRLGIVAVVAWASALGPDVDLRDLDADVLVVAGELDAVIPVGQSRASLARLPTDSAFVVIEGMTHGQFARYDPDAESPIGRSDDATLIDVTAETVAFLRDVLAR